MATDTRDWALPDGNQLALGCTPGNFVYMCPPDDWADPELRMLRMAWVRDMHVSTLRAYLHDYDIAMQCIAEGRPVQKKWSRNGSRQRMWCSLNPVTVEKLVAVMREELARR